MPDIVSGNLSSKEVGALIVSSSESKGWLSEYVRDVIDYVPYLSTSLSTANDSFHGAIDLMPSMADCVEYGKTWLPFKEKVDDVGLVLKIPQWAFGNFSIYNEIACKTTKTLTGGLTGYISLRFLAKAIKSKDPFCISLTCAGLVLDVAKIGSNVFPYNYNVIRYDAINVLIKGAAYACIELKLCDEAKKFISNVKSDGFKKLLGSGFKKLWGTSNR